MLTLAEIDDVLIRYADTLSPVALSAKVEGMLSPAQCRSRIAQLLDAPDWLTAAQQDQLVTMKMRMLISQLEGMNLTARVAEVLIRALEGLGARLDRRTEATEADLSKLYSFQGAVLLDAVSIAMNHMREALAKGDAELEAIWDQHLENAIRFAQIELSKHEASPDPLELETVSA